MVRAREAPRWRGDTRGGGRGHPHARETRARGRGRVAPRGRSARAAAKNAQSRSILQDALPATPCSPPERGRQGKVDRRDHRAAGLTILEGSGEDTARRGTRRGGSRRHERGRDASEGCAWRDPNASPACAEGNPRVVRKPRNADRATIETRKRRCGDARVPSWKPRTRDARTGTVRAVRNERARRAGEPLETNDFCQFPAKRRKISHRRGSEEEARARRKPISWFLTRRHLNIALPNADVGIFLF